MPRPATLTPFVRKVLRSIAEHGPSTTRQVAHRVGGESNLTMRALIALLREGLVRHAPRHTMRALIALDREGLVRPCAKRRGAWRYQMTGLGQAETEAAR